MAESQSTSKKAAPAASAPAVTKVAPAAKEQQPYVETNVLAIVSLIAGIAGLTIFPFIGSVTALITGHIGRNELRAKGQNGEGLATAGLITGYIGLGFILLFVLLFFGIIIAAIVAGGPMYRY